MPQQNPPKGPTGVYSIDLTDDLVATTTTPQTITGAKVFSGGIVASAITVSGSPYTPSAFAVPGAISAISIIGKILDHGGMVYNVKDPTYGASATGQLVNDAVINIGSPTILTSATAGFLSSDVGSSIVVKGAGAAGANLATTISVFTSSTQVSLANAASTGVSAASIAWRDIGKLVPDGAITSGLKVVTSATGLFTPGDVGKNLVIQQAGAGPGPLTTTITAYNSATSVTVAAAATFTVNGQVVWWGGTDDAAAINAAIVAANAAGGGIVFLPPGHFFLNSNPIFPLSNVWILGSGRNATTIVPNTGGHSGGSQDALRITQSSNYYSWVTITDLGIDAIFQDINVGNGMTMQGVDYLTIERVRATRTGSFGVAVGSVGGTPPYIESPVIRDLYVDNQQSGAVNDSFGGGGCIRGLIDGYVCINPSGTFMDFTNMQECILHNLRGINHNAVNSRNWALGADFGWVDCLVESFYFDTVYRGIVFSGTGATVSTGIKFRNGKIANSQKDCLSVIGNGGSATKAKRIQIENVDCTAWNIDTTGNAAMIMQEVSDVEITGCKFYSPTGSPADIQFDKQGAGAGCDTMNVHDNTLNLGVSLTTVVQPYRIQTFSGTGLITENIAGLTIAGQGPITIQNGWGLQATPSVIVNGGGGSGLIKLQTNGTDRFQIDAGGHLISTTAGTPSTSGLVANLTSATFTGNDTRGIITLVVAAGGIAAGASLCTCTFSTSYGATAPVIMVVNENATNLANVDFFIKSQSTGVSFVLGNSQALVVGTYVVAYIVIG